MKLPCLVYVWKCSRKASSAFLLHAGFYKPFESGRGWPEPCHRGTHSHLWCGHKTGASPPPPAETASAWGSGDGWHYHEWRRQSFLRGPAYPGSQVRTVAVFSSCGGWVSQLDEWKPCSEVVWGAEATARHTHHCMALAELLQAKIAGWALGPQWSLWKPSCCVARKQELVTISDVGRFLYKALPHADEEANSVLSHVVPVKKAIVVTCFLLRKLCVYWTLVTLQENLH